MSTSRSSSWLRRFGQSVLAVAAVAGTSFATAQTADWPKGPITFVAPFSPGGGGDTMTRLFANEFGKTLGQTFIVENKPGAGGNIGTAAVARTTADGNTVVFGTMGTMGTNHALYKNPGFAIDDLEPVAIFGHTALALVVGSNSPFRTVADIIAEAKKRPGELSCASGGNGTASHLACAMLQQMAGIDVNHIPYKSASGAYVDMMTDRISFMIDVMTPLTPQIKGGKLRAIAVTMKDRVPALPDTPTIAATVPGYEIFSWDGMFAPKGVPAARLDKMNAAVNAALAKPEFVQLMTGRGYTLTPMSRPAFAEFVKKQYVRMGDVVRKMGITLD